MRCLWFSLVFNIVLKTSMICKRSDGVSMLKDHPANDDEASVAKLSEAELRYEIKRLRAALSECASRISELEQLAYNDPLVSLPNRRHFMGKLKTAVERVESNGGDVAVLFLDVDGLKEINDNFGHQAGDRALVQLGVLLTSSVRSTDLIARLSGDEFAVLLEHTDECSIWQMAERVVETVDHFQFGVGEVCLDLSVAIGVAMVKPGDTPETVLTRADSEMYRIKSMGRGKPSTR